MAIGEERWCVRAVSIEVGREEWILIIMHWWVYSGFEATLLGTILEEKHWNY